MTDTKKPKFHWMPEAMPKVTAEIARLRKVHGSDVVNEAIRRGMKGESGFFFAMEGALMVGMPSREMNGFESVYTMLENGFPVDFYLELNHGKN